MKFADRPFFDFMRNLKLITASILAILVAIIVVQNRGTGSNARTLCYRRHASCHSAVYHHSRRVRPWSPSHTLAKHTAASNPLRRSAGAFSEKSNPQFLSLACRSMRRASQIASKVFAASVHTKKRLMRSQFSPGPRHRSPRPKDRFAAAQTTAVGISVTAPIIP